MRAIVIANPVEKGMGGGAKRSFKVLELYPKYGIEVYLYVPFQRLINMIFSHIINENENLLKGYIKSFKKLEKSGVLVPNYIYEILESAEIRSNLIDLLRGHISSLKRFVFFNLNLKHLSKEKKFIKEFLKELKDNRIDYIYAMNGNFEDVYSLKCISQVIHKPLFILLQIEPLRIKKSYEENLLMYIHNTITSGLYNFKTKKVYQDILKSNRLRCIFSVSTAPIKLSKLDELAQKFNVKTKILKPAYSIDQDILNYRRIKNKGNYAIFYARLVPGKGIFEIPYIWRIVEENIPDAKLIVCGNFGTLRHKKLFFNLIKELGLKNIHYKGYVSGANLYELVSNAKVLVYPSHEDSFSLVVLESLALGTIVVAYDIPAIREVYKDISAVYVVKEGDVKLMAEKVIKVLKMEEKEYQDRLRNSKNFLEIHSSWENVAKTEITEIKKLL